MRETSPAVNLSVNELLVRLPPAIQTFVSEIRRQKLADARPRPSTALLDFSSILTIEKRAKILDMVASLVDENLWGRSDMCSQFAELLTHSLRHLDVDARTAMGEAIYYSDKGAELFRWEHVWVRVGVEVIDGNADSLFENPAAPPTIRVAPYWGPIVRTPTDRRLREHRGRRQVTPDDDVSTVWWPELRAALDAEILPQESGVRS